MRLKLVRDELQPERSFGKLYVDGMYFGETLEDTDRFLETHPEAKVYGKTAIPRGLYPVTLSHSHRFDKVLPELLDVPYFTGIRIHGGNDEDDSLGCILLGRVRDQCRIHNCKDVVGRLILKFEDALERGETITLEVT